MKKKTLCLCVIGLLAAAGLLTGCTRTSEELILSKENSATEEEIKTSLPENKDLDEVPWMKKKQNGKRHLYQRMERLFPVLHIQSP